LCRIKLHIEAIIIHIRITKETESRNRREEFDCDDNEEVLVCKIIIVFDDCVVTELNVTVKIVFVNVENALFLSISNDLLLNGMIPILSDTPKVV
jgi:hypothetical protein